MRTIKIIVLLLMVLMWGGPGYASFGGGTFGEPSRVLFISLSPTSTSQTLTAAQAQSVLVINNGAGVAKGGAIINLPVSVKGMDYTIITDLALTFRLKPASGEIINYSTNTANSKVKNTSAAIGDSIEVFCSTAGKWSVKGRFGTWVTDNNPG